MTVRDLIVALLECNLDAKVVIVGRDEGDDDESRRVLDIENGLGEHRKPVAWITVGEPAGFEMKQVA